MTSSTGGYSEEVFCTEPHPQPPCFTLIPAGLTIMRTNKERLGWYLLACGEIGLDVSSSCHICGWQRAGFFYMFYTAPKKIFGNNTSKISVVTFTQDHQRGRHNNSEPNRNPWRSSPLHGVGDFFNIVAGSSSTVLIWGNIKLNRANTLTVKCLSVILKVTVKF